MFNITFNNIKNSLYYNKCITCKSRENLNECNDCLCLVCEKCDNISISKSKNVCKRCKFIINQYNYH